MSSAASAGNRTAGHGDLPKATPKGHSDLQDWQKKAVLAAAAVVVFLAGSALVKKVKNENEDAEDKAKNAASKAKGKVKEIFGK